MIQFGLVSYQDQPDYAKSLVLIEHYKKSKNVDDAGMSLLRAALADNDGIGKAVLIAARLFFWGQLDILFVQHELGAKISFETFNGADVFEKQELFDCLGQDLLVSLVGSRFDFVTLSSEWEEADYMVDIASINHNPQEIWSYIPPPTGFFSVIENIVLAMFFCKVHNKGFKLDQHHDWWRYPIPFIQLMGPHLVSEFNLEQQAEKFVMWDLLRQYFRYINPENFNLLKQFKAQQYKKIKNALHTYLDTVDARQRPNPEDGMLFVRGGDKIQLETIEAPLESLRADISELRNRNVEIRVLSDDYGLATRLCRALELPPEANITGENRSGYHLHAGHSVDDVHTIINNYLMLGNARYSLSCPSSNLVNSAHWSNRILDNKFKPRSLPALRYLYL